MSERDQVVELVKGHWIVIPGTRLEPGPHHVEAGDGVAEFVHLRKVGFNILGIPLHRPLHRGFGRDPVRANRDKALAVVREISSVKMNCGQFLRR